MQLSCIHCGKAFTITKDQLGGRGTCPHCGGEIRLPKAEEDAAEAPPAERSHWWENSVSGLVSVVFHMLLMLVLALISYNSYSGEGLGEDVLIGELPSVQLSDAQDEELSAEQATSESAEEQFEDELEVEPPVETSSSSEFADLAAVSPSTSGGGDAGSFTAGAVSAGGGSMGGGSWDGMLRNLRRNGLDIVITFDSTGSMGGEIRQVKRQVKRIGDTLIRLVPKARIGLCTYRDEGDEYVVRGLPLTNQVQEIDSWLAGVEADAGGDTPEAVHEGLKWSVTNNRFRQNARKVILLFGDAPPHDRNYEECLKTASDFHRQESGVISTVTCRKSRKIPEFEEIAQMGGGEAFLTSDERQIMTQLLVLVFGSRYRGKVVDAFELMER